MPGRRDRTCRCCAGSGAPMCATRSCRSSSSNCCSSPSTWRATPGRCARTWQPLSEVARQELSRIADDESAVIEQQLGQVASLAEVLRLQTTAALGRPAPHARDRERLRLQPSGALTTWHDDGGAAVYWSSRHQAGPRRVRAARAARDGRSAAARRDARQSPHRAVLSQHARFADAHLAVDRRGRRVRPEYQRRGIQLLLRGGCPP